MLTPAHRLDRIMNTDLLTIDGLHKAKIVATYQIMGAVEAYLEDPTREKHVIADGYTIDLKTAVRNHEWAWKIARDPAASARLKRGSIWNAILLARATKA